MTATRALHIYTVSFTTKEKLPSTRVNYHVMNVVADNAEIAKEIIEALQNPSKITDVKYMCTAFDLGGGL